MIAIRPSTQNKKVFIQIVRIKPGVQRDLRHALTEVLRENTQHSQKLIKNPPKTGRIYKFRGRDHQASAPGQPPADRSGDLRKTSGYRVYGWERGEFGDRMPYGVFLEDGTRRMRKRPHIVRTVREKERDNFVTLSNTVHKGMTTF